MIWHLVAAFVVGIACAGIALFLRKLSGQRLPKWIIPVCAGIGMLGYQVYTEYDWFDHKVRSLPVGSVVVSEEAKASFWRPWTFVFPMTTAFTVLDVNNVNKRLVENQNIVELMLYRFEKQHVDRVRNQPYVLNCDSREFVPIKENLQLNLEEARMLSGEDPVYKAVCR